ncbi:MAG: YbaB/EbfC family nucleoid-associated protein [Candidatus Bipolaricaulota bacterium]|nr:YbaB/EbfC family nucleoid-associated protein [Candidatus Bipolaricaulota bacterium]
MRGMRDMGNIMRQAKRLQEELEKKQQELAQLKVEASAGGGMVTAVVNGQGKLQDLSIEQEVVDPADVGMLVDLVIAAVQEAQKNADELAQERLGPLTQGMNLPGMPGP